METNTVFEVQPKPYGDNQVATNGLTKVLIGGFDNAGKSTLACSLYRALQNQGVETSLYELDRWSDTHEPILGKKSWQQRQKVPEVSVSEYAEFAGKFINHSSGVVLGDIEGRYQNPHIRCLKGSADYALLLTRDPIEKDQNTEWLQTTEGWEELFDELGVPIAIRAHSIIDGQKPPSGTIPVYNLERQLVPNHPDIQAIAKLVIELSQRVHV